MTDLMFQEIECVVFPGGALDEGQRNDVRIVAEAAKYAALLVTNDGLNCPAQIRLEV
jgi:hypothetical protein